MKIRTEGQTNKEETITQKRDEWQENRDYSNPEQILNLQHDYTTYLDPKMHGILKTRETIRLQRLELEWP